MDMPEEIVAGIFNSKRYWQDKDPLLEITDAAHYTSTTKYEELKALCERMHDLLVHSMFYAEDCLDEDGEAPYAKDFLEKVFAARKEYTNFMKDKG